MTGSKRALAATLLSAILLATSIARATDQTDDDRSTEKASTETPGEAADRPMPGPQSTTSAGSPRRVENKSEKNGDIFTPSEEISEDFAVSFPVDI